MYNFVLYYITQSCFFYGIGVNGLANGGKLDCVIRGGRVVLPGRVEEADIGIRGGVIAEISVSIRTAAKETIDAGGMFVMAGTIDACVHASGRGTAGAEGFRQISAALAAGGCTTFFDMPDGDPPVLGADALVARAEAAAAEGSYVDYALWGGYSHGNFDELQTLATAGAIGVKAYMCLPDGRVADGFHEIDDVALYEGMIAVSSRGKLMAVHPESGEIVAAMEEKLRERDGTGTGTGTSTGTGITGAGSGLGLGAGVAEYLASRPVAAELDAVRRALLIAERTDCPLHLAPISCPQAIDLIWEAKLNGVDVTVETSPHYLLFADENAEYLGWLGKCAPPLRTRQDKEGLWVRLQDGKIDGVASGHYPAPVREADAGATLPTGAGSGGGYRQLPAGIAGGQSTLELMFDEGYLSRGVPLPLLSRLLSEMPAKRFGLFPHKGNLAAGADADIVLIDPEAPYILRKEQLFNRHAVSPYAGRPFRCRVAMTLSRGRIVYKAGEGLVAAPQGCWMKTIPGPVRKRHIF